MTELQLRHWQNGVTLFTHNISVTPNNSLAHKELANALKQQGKLDEAIFQYSKALKINPNYDEAHNNLGVILAHQKHYKEAIYHYKVALRIKPSYTEAHNNLGTVLIQEGNVKEGIYQYYKALKCNPRYAGSYYNLAKIYVNKNQIEKGILFYKKALELNPEMIQVLYNLSWLLSSTEDENYRNGEEAIKLAEKLCRVTQYQQPLAFDALGAAYAETGKYDAAVLSAQKGLRLALRHGPEELVSGLKERLQLYKIKKPYRQYLKRKNAS